MPHLEIPPSLPNWFAGLSHPQIYQIGQDHYSASRFDMAVICFNYLLLFPNGRYYICARYSRAQIYLIRGDYKDALSDVKVAIKRERDHTNLRKCFFLRGQIYFALGDYTNARDDYTSALIFLDDPMIYSARHEVYLMMGDIYLRRGEISLGMRETRLAIEDLRAAFQCDPNPNNRSTYYHAINTLIEFLSS